MTRLLPRAFSRPIHLCVAVYALIAVLYATNNLIVAPLNHLLKTVLVQTAQEANIFGLSWSPSPHPRSRPPANVPPIRIEQRPGQVPLGWPMIGIKNSTLRSTTTMDTRLLLSKAFSQSMRPSDVVPFYYRADGNFDPQDVTITTLVTSNRFKVFASLVESYRGPISVTIHVTNETGHKRELVAALHDLYHSSPTMRRYVDVHLVVDAFDRQFNTWRNIARLFARTEFVMMLDVDFAVCTDFRASIRNDPGIREKLMGGNVALVVPAFEYVKKGVTRDEFPKDKQALVSQVERSRLAMFHASWPVGHNASEYARFYAADPGEVYKVTQYQSAYEPYVIFRKDGPPWCDERFIGYGGNKAACLFEMYVSGVSFHVLADHFLIHQDHVYEEKARRNERRYNKKMYIDFREETCLRYLKGYHDAGVLETSSGENLHAECMKMKTVSRVAARLKGGAE